MLGFACRFGHSPSLRLYFYQSRALPKRSPRSRRRATNTPTFHPMVSCPTVRPAGLVHIFGKATDGLVQEFGSEREAFEAAQEATQGGVSNLSEVFQTVVRVGGQDATVRGRVVDGVVRIGESFIR